MPESQAAAETPLTVAQPQVDTMFGEVVTELDRGRVLQDLSGDLRALVAAVRETGKKGKLTLVLRVSPRNRNPDCREVVIVDEIKLDPPALDKPDTLFFAGRDGELSRSPLEQSEIPFRSDGAGTNGEGA